MHIMGTDCKLAIIDLNQRSIKIMAYANLQSTIYNLQSLEACYESPASSQPVRAAADRRVVRPHTGGTPPDGRGASGRFRGAHVMAGGAGTRARGATGRHTAPRCDCAHAWRHISRIAAVGAKPVFLRNQPSPERSRRIPKLLA